jgi:hypothetical protein
MKKQLHALLRSSLLELARIMYILTFLYKHSDDTSIFSQTKGH